MLAITCYPKAQHDILLDDMYCPGIKSNIKDRVCNYCGIYYLRITTVKRCRAGDGCESNSKVVEETEFKEVQDNKEAEEDKIIVEDET